MEFCKHIGLKLCAKFGFLTGFIIEIIIAASKCGKIAMFSNDIGSYCNFLNIGTVKF